ncbi:NACHT domain-containing protein [Streptomyces paludis]|uniref:NACHT domain-containing protein n=2 Tax=Streptomyces paludis TaxID=2282738 RepID=A0A345HKE8_9ACTN|nr:NACHT domain-containing protein [Streptomyces paludis]
MALVRLAGAVGGAVAKSLLSPRPGAALVPDPLRPLPRPASPDRLAKVLARRLSPSYASYAALPEHERLAAVDSVRDTFAAAGDLGAERLFALDLDPARLRDELRSPAAGLGERARGLYDELLGLCCAHLVEQLTAHPSFPARAAVEQTRAAGRTRELVADVRERLGPRADAVALDFEARYAAYVTATHGRLELFGLTLGRSSRELPLDTAYISLAMSGEREIPGLPRVGPATLTTEQALAGADRLLLRGAAGSGKSTLVQWLAVTAARRGFLPELADLNRCVPFVLRLRAFTAAEALPLPEDFLRAAGVPLTPAGGWAESLLTEGRALVLVDGVDEVPTRLRARTEAWLKSLVAAFPRARYVVTTRPSAVPVDWLSGLSFVAHSLLPMERETIGSFVGHWHDAARLECQAADERARLDTYETSLMHAVTTRRDLGRLATNPLMCALLCALNRDRRMQLPRARKELYDAALEMLLVRRDTEREIQGVEGVTLTRDEQTALLQRLAYWLIRNGQVEAARDEAVEMVGAWLAAMPQVAGAAEHVFQHLLIRSGLLREPVPGAVDFVHRTFQDYLGAKAAVEARDFGVLVKNAHDDQWDDVVRMAVGHARVDERARLLKQLLRRADRAPRLRNRLVLLAATCLEHAPELDPEVRGEVERRTEELVPPRGRQDAEELAKVGELVIELLPGPEGLDESTAAAVVRTAGLIKGDAALAVISRFREDVRPWVVDEVSEAWGSFDSESYAKAILSGQDWRECYLTVYSPEQLLALRHVPQAQNVGVIGNHRDLTPVLTLEQLNGVQLVVNDVLTDLSVLTALPHLTSVSLNRCLGVRDLKALARPGLTHLSLTELHHEIQLDSLSEMPDLQFAHLASPLLMEGVGELPIGPQLTSLSLGLQARYLDLAGIERWPHLTELTLRGSTQIRQLAGMPSLSGLRVLDLHLQDPLDLRDISHLAELQTLMLWNCEVPDGLDPLRDLPALTTLRFFDCGQSGSPLDLSPLADLEQLTITLWENDTPATGADLFPPGRIIRDPN